MFQLSGFYYIPPPPPKKKHHTHTHTHIKAPEVDRVLLSTLRASGVLRLHELDALAQARDLQHDFEGARSFSFFRVYGLGFRV